MLSCTCLSRRSEGRKLGKTFGWLVIVGVVGWFTLGSPITTLTKTLWSDRPAPWETVDAFFYPDKANLSVHTAISGFKNLDDCRSWAKDQASAIGDGTMKRSDYECGIGKLQSFGELTMYRLTAR